jgi:glycosyltransferase involved in cell wall biosynthesis
MATRFLMIAAGYPPLRKAGLETGCQRLSRALAARGHQVIVLTQRAPGHDSVEVEAPGLTIHRVIEPLAVGPLWGITYMTQVRRWAVKLAADWDVAICHKLALHSVVIPSIARKLGKLSASLLVNAGEYSDIRVLRDHKGGGLLLAQALQSDAFFCLSRVSREELLREGIDVPRLLPFRYMVPLDAFQPGGDASPDELLFLGRFHPQKNLPGLIDACERASARLPRLRLRLIGKGEHEVVIRQRIAASPAKDAIVLQDWTDDPAAAYRRALAVVSASVAEGLSNVSVEAAACGAPTILTDISGAREVTDPEGHLGPVPEGTWLEGATGLLVNAKDTAGMAEAMVAIAERPDWRARIALQARQVAEERFSEEACVGLFLEGVRRMQAGRQP